MGRRRRTPSRTQHSLAGPATSGCHPGHEPELDSESEASSSLPPAVACPTRNQKHSLPVAGSRSGSSWHWHSSQKCDGCSRSFKNRRGLTLHQRKCDNWRKFDLGRRRLATSHAASDHDIGRTLDSGLQDRLGQAPPVTGRLQLELQVQVEGSTQAQPEPEAATVAGTQAQTQAASNSNCNTTNDSDSEGVLQVTSGALPLAVSTPTPSRHWQTDQHPWQAQLEAEFGMSVDCIQVRHDDGVQLQL